MLQEERRLFYVAMTRARKVLFILYVSMDSNFQVCMTWISVLHYDIFYYCCCATEDGLS